MIKITGVAKQMDNAVVTVVFDDFNGEEQEVTRSFPIAQALQATHKQIREFILDKVKTARAHQAETALTEKFAPLLNVDIEQGLPEVGEGHVSL